MELFNNFKKNDIPKEKKPFKISILFKLNTCMVTRGRKLNFDVPRWINLLCMTVWNLRLLWNPYSIFTLQDNWKTNIKIPINPCGLSLLRTPPTSYTHYIKQSLTDLLNYKWDIQRFHLNLCEFVHFLYGTKIPANGFWKKLNNRLSYFDKQWRWNSLLALTALWQTVLFSLDAWRFPFNKRLVFLVFLHQFVLRYLYFI